MKITIDIADSKTSTEVQNLSTISSQIEQKQDVGAAFAAATADTADNVSQMANTDTGGPSPEALQWMGSNVPAPDQPDSVNIGSSPNL
jgi:hypothetical protein